MVKKGKILIVSLYVDDLIYTGNDKQMMGEFKSSMKKKFAMTDLGKMKYFLGVEVNQTQQGIFINQQKYASEILTRFGMQDCNTVCTPIVLELCLAARYMDKPTEMHVIAVKRIMRYLKGTMIYGILYKSTDGENVTLVGWTDSDYAGDYDDRKSTSGYVFSIGTSAISWSSKKQPIVTLSTTEAEFIAAASSACQGIWLRNVLKQLRQEQVTCTKSIVIIAPQSSYQKIQLSTEGQNILM
ncbi:uncharacterized mitochondrial protein AtMg00810-like [Trifolium pratense]|uniref:uncharacterized mitochondrial protein AtMg00810-like n=1 Tax=Trifolium pratense TaxID=57577 RepID=UPI001E692DE3|nr:uncharacterized mitochondrial protein AtMg00810-like [Trifolium pratense]